MYCIKLAHATKCHDATEWCKKEFADNSWEMWITDFRGRYTFEFKESSDAVLFALKWAE